MLTKEADVVVVGFGGAGAAAAIAAHDAGAKVIVLEKHTQGGGNTRYSGGTIRKVADVERAITYIEGFSFEAIDRDTLRGFLEAALQTPEWLTSLGAKLQPADMEARSRIFPPGNNVVYPHLPGVGGYGSRLVVSEAGGEPGGTTLWGFLFRTAEKRGIEVLYQTPAKSLVTGPDKRITGVMAVNAKGETVTVKARRAVILTCGGFELNKEMLNQYVGLKTILAAGTDQNTGDGIKMAQAVGADLWHMTAVSCCLGYDIPEIPAGVLHRMRGPGYIYVDQNANRFANEMDDVHAWLLSTNFIDHRNARFPRVPAFVIFDDDARRGGPMVRTPAGRYTDFYHWSEDNSAEVEKGWIKSADTIGELAPLLGLRPDILQKTVAEYNQCCIGCYDPHFDRPPATLIPIARPPFYGIAVYPCLLNTQGGPRHNARAEVLDVWGKPIKGLYAAGEIGSMWSILYPGGGNVTECLALGRIAGRNAAAEKP